jgi:adenylate kinase
MSATAFTVSASQFTGAKQRRALNARKATASSSSRRAVTMTVAAGPKKIVIAGAPASGKGTQCELIVEKYGLEHISAGDLLRAAVAAGTDLGKRAKEFMDRGDLVPDEVVVGMVVEALDTDKAKSAGWLLDGYPRSASQADAITAEGIVPDSVILLDVPDSAIVEARRRPQDGPGDW